MRNFFGKNISYLYNNHDCQCIYLGFITIIILSFVVDFNDNPTSFLNECVLMKKLNHPNVLPLLGICIESDHASGSPFMILPFMINGDLKSYLKSKRIRPACIDQLPEVYIYMTVYKIKL